MNNNNLFSLLAGIAKAMNESGEYKKLDFTKKEDVEKLDNAILTLKNNEFFSSLFNSDIFDGLQEKAHQIYNDAQKKREEEAKKTIPIRPQTQVPEKVKNNIVNYACEYLNTMILPNSNLTQKQVEDIINGLVDFACWIYNKKS